MLGWPTHSAAGGGRCDQHEGKGRRPGRQGLPDPCPEPGLRGGDTGSKAVKLVTGQVGGRGAAIRKTFSLTSRTQRAPFSLTSRTQRAAGPPACSPASLAPAPSRSRPPRLLFSSPLPAARSQSPTGPGQAAPAPGARGS